METASPLQIVVSPFVGRTYHTRRALKAESCVLNIPTPYACTIYKQFRTEVCAECWNYDGGRRAFLTSRELGESAGLCFCDQRCKEAWLERDGEEMVRLLAEMESARRRKEKGKDKETTTTVDPAQENMAQYVSQAWEVARQQSTNAKALRKWTQIQLDDFEADLARYVLMSLYHCARESDVDGHSDGRDEHPTTLESQSTSSLTFGKASWTDFASLQSGELQQITKFPELLTNHIRIFKVLKSRFGVSVWSTTSARAKLVDVITTQNVRTALGVDPGNSFGIWEVPVTEESEGLGFGVYPVPSFFNHHCAPNVRKERNGRSLRFVTTRDISAGEELCISYGHVEHMDLQQRRKELQDGWFFACQCSRCRADEALENS